MEIKHKLTGETLIDLYGDDLCGADLSGADLSGVDLCEASLYGADLSGAQLSGADLSGANLRGADLSGSSLYGANLRAANLRGTNLCGTKGILTFVGERDLLIYFKNKGTYYFRIGCMTKTSDEWLRSFSEIGAQNGYSADTTRLYGDVIKLFSQYDLNLS